MYALDAFGSVLSVRKHWAGNMKHKTPFSKRITKSLSQFMWNIRIDLMEQLSIKCCAIFLNHPVEQFREERKKEAENIRFMVIKIKTIIRKIKKGI